MLPLQWPPFRSELSSSLSKRTDRSRISRCVLNIFILVCVWTIVSIDTNLQLGF
ncbi:hypothetical protein PO124_25225 [Bacillus licheniformis]|nr:hypothetical protein [Bacillus licheniformis]